MASLISRARRVASEATLEFKLAVDWEKGMNDQEVTMSHALPATNLIAYEKAVQAAGSAIALVKRVPAPLKGLADQVIRSASSVPANLAEGQGRLGRDTLHHWRIAYASAKEVESHLRLLCTSQAIHRGKARVTLELYDEVDGAPDAPPAARAMTWRLLHPHR